MIAKGFASVGWVAGIGVAALICYMFSLQVAAERADLQALDRRIVELRQSIRSLHTELGTRGRVHQLQHWAATDFGFVAPAAGQLVDNEATLASIEIAPTTALSPPVQLAAAPRPAERRLVGPTARPTAPAAASPPVVRAVTPAAPAPAPAPAAPTPSTPIVRAAASLRASTPVAPSPSAPTILRRAAVVIAEARPTPLPTRPQAVRPPQPIRVAASVSTGPRRESPARERSGRADRRAN